MLGQVSWIFYIFRRHKLSEVFPNPKQLFVKQRMRQHQTFFSYHKLIFILSYPQERQYQIQVIIMNVYLLVLLNILLVGWMAHLVGDNQHQFVPYQTQMQCIKTNTTNRLCAECFKRDQSLIHNRGVKIQSNKQISILKIKDLQTYLSCEDYLQLIHTETKINPNQQITIEQTPSISKLLTEINAVLQVENSTSNHAIQPWYNQLVIYRYESKISKESSIIFPNPENYKKVKFCFLIGFNFALLFVSMAWVVGKALVRDEDRIVNILFVCIAVLLELFGLDVQSDFVLFLARVIVLNIGFILIGLHYFKIMFSFTCGLLISYYEAPNLIYISFVLLLMISYSKTPSDNIKYLMAMSLFILINHIYLYFYTMHLNDLRNIFIDACLFALIPVGLMLLGNRHKEAYQEVNSENKPNELNEYQQQPSNV